MMINLFFRNFTRFSRFKFEDYNNEDLATMCGLLREKYQLHNDEVQTSGLIKLLDHAGRVIGVYTASQARKKANNLNMDMVLINSNASPVLCKAVDFRKQIINKFYDQIVIKSQKNMISKANSVKSIKISPGLGKNDIVIKVKQINQLSQKHAKVRVFMSIKESQKSQCLSKLEEVKSLLLNKCYIEEQISNRRFEEVEEVEQNGKPDNRSQTYSFVVRARQVDESKKVVDDKKRDPDTMTKTFLKKYYSQTDGEMMDLKSAGLFETELGYIELQKKQGQQDKLQRQPKFEEEVLREAEARMLNKRLKILLSFAV